MLGSFTSNDFAKTSQVVLADAETQVKEEVGAPRFSVFGRPTESTGGDYCKPCPEELTKDRVYWLASFKDKQSYDEEHKQRPSNVAFVPKLMATGLNQE